MGDTSKDKEGTSFQLEAQLHKQYATNASSNTSNFIAFVVAILAVFYCYGYVFIFNTNDFAQSDYFTFQTIGNSSHILFTLDVLCFVAAVSLLLLTFLISYCLNLGWQQRRDHIIINRIREHRMESEILGNLYSPDNKSWFSFIPNSYLYFICLFIIMVILIIISTICKMCYCRFVSSVFLFVISAVIVVVIPFVLWKRFYKQYKQNCKK